MQRSRTTAMALLSAIFLAGGIGGWLTHGMLDGRGRRSGRHSSERHVERLSTELELSATQKDSIRAILERRRIETDALWKELHPRFTEVRNRTRLEIEAQLDPEQAVEYRTIEAEADRRRARADSLRSRDRGRR